MDFSFLSDPSPIIFYPCQQQTDSCFVDLIDVTQACEDANSKPVDVDTLADFDYEESVGNSLEEILMLEIVQDISRLRFGQDFEVDV